MDSMRKCKRYRCCVARHDGIVSRYYLITEQMGPKARYRLQLQGVDL
jgi:hypothetical protein